MPGRQYNPTETAYGFNGKRSDDEIYGTKNFYNYGKRMYDPRLARFPSPDPLIIKDQKYPELSPYQYASNRPIDGIDLDGLEWSKTKTVTSKGVTKIKYTAKIKVKNSSETMSDAQAKEFAKSIEAQIENKFSGKTDENVDVSVDVQMEFDESAGKGDYYMEFVDDVEGGTESAVGKVDEIGNAQENRIQIESGLGKYTIETGTHETGHTVGLRHENDPKNPEEVKGSMGENNIMQSEGFGNTEVTGEQRGQVDENVPEGDYNYSVESPARDNTDVVQKR